MPGMGFTKFERFFRAAGSVSVEEWARAYSIFRLLI
jgi:hypothetical protein